MHYQQPGELLRLLFDPRNQTPAGGARLRGLIAEAPIDLIEKTAFRIADVFILEQIVAGIELNAKGLALADRLIALARGEARARLVNAMLDNRTLKSTGIRAAAVYARDLPTAFARCLASALMTPDMLVAVLREKEHVKPLSTACLQMIVGKQVFWAVGEVRRAVAERCAPEQLESLVYTGTLWKRGDLSGFCEQFKGTDVLLRLLARDEIVTGLDAATRLLVLDSYTGRERERIKALLEAGPAV